MALNKTKLQNDINTLLGEMSKIEKNPAKAQKEFAKQLANIIDEYVKTATIVATPASIVTAALSNSGGPVVAVNNIVCTIN
jgi:hypothetical protein